MNSSTSATETSNEMKPSVSLADLKLEVDTENEDIRNCQASHDFYMSMWKSAPYAIIALAPATVYASFIAIDYAAGPILAAFLIFLIGVIGWYKQESLNETIEKKLSFVSTRKKQLERRMIKVETEFRNMGVSDMQLYVDNFRFDDSLAYSKHSDYRAMVVPQILEDMMHHDSDLLRMRVEFDDITNQLLDDLKSFDEVTVELITDLNRDAGIPTTNEDLPERIHATYYVMSNLVGSVVDVKPESGRPRVQVSSNQARHFIELLFGEQDSSNPYPLLLQATELRTLASGVEELRKKALRAYTAIDETIRVEYQE